MIAIIINISSQSACISKMNFLNEQNIAAIFGLVGAIIGGVITSIPIFIQEFRKHQRWLIEKKIAYIEDQIEEIDKNKKLFLKDLHNLFTGEKFEDNHNFVSSVPMEIIDILEKYLPDDETIMIRDLPEMKKREIFIEIATVLEKKKIELKKNIKKLLT